MYSLLRVAGFHFRLPVVLAPFGIHAPSSSSPSSPNFRCLRGLGLDLLFIFVAFNFVTPGPLEKSCGRLCHDMMTSYNRDRDSTALELEEACSLSRVRGFHVPHLLLSYSYLRVRGFHVLFDSSMFGIVFGAISLPKPLYPIPC